MWSQNKLDYYKIKRDVESSVDNSFKTGFGNLVLAVVHRKLMESKGRMADVTKLEQNATREENQIRRLLDANRAKEVETIIPQIEKILNNPNANVSINYAALSCRNAHLLDVAEQKFRAMQQYLSKIMAMRMNVVDEEDVFYNLGATCIVKAMTLGIYLDSIL